MSVDRLRTEESNPRGIPQAKFLENIEDFINPKTCTDADVNNFLNELQMRLEQYKFMEQNKQTTLDNLNVKIPDIRNTLEMCQFLKSKADKISEDGGELESEDKKIEVDYELNDTIYATAVIDSESIDKVCLWLGANVMLEYPIDEAIGMLKTRLEKTEHSKTTSLEDLDYLRANITTMEVNTARVYNWDVQRRKKLEAEAEKR